VTGATPLIVMALVLGVLYVMRIRPQRQQQRDARSSIQTAGVGDDVLTNGGIYGTIVRVDGNDVEVEIAQGVTVHMTRQGIVSVLPPEEEEDDETEDSEEEHESEPADGLDEVGVTGLQQAVTNDADASGTDADRR